MTKKRLKNRTVFTNSLKNSLFIKLKEHSEKTDIPFSRLLDRAVTMYLESLKK